MFCVFVDRRDTATLLPITHQYVLPGMTIYSDEWQVYNAISNDIRGADRCIH